MDTTLLAYSLGEDRSFLWRVTPQEVQSEVLPGRSELESLSRSFYERASSRDAGLEEYQHASSVLGRVLLGPVAQHLDSKRVVVIAEGILQYVPFGALSLPGTSEPLLSRLEVVNLPSASCLAAIRQQANARTGAPKSIAIFADPVFEAKDSRVRQTVFAGTLGADRHDRFSRLLFSAVEARGIADTAGDGSLLFALDFDASRERFSRADIGNFRFIHLATHGMLNSVHPELSGIVLSLVDENGNAKDGFLGLQDIYNLKLPAELIVLSACQTALGKEIKGEGLVGLTRGFMYAGASRVVASLWTVDDEVTSALMVEFYKQMFNERVPATAALRRAQLKTRSNPRWQEPYYWAGFVIQGEWR
jgi:CHAT domain-containing protein